MKSHSAKLMDDINYIAALIVYKCGYHNSYIIHVLKVQWFSRRRSTRQQRQTTFLGSRDLSEQCRAGMWWLTTLWNGFIRKASPCVCVVSDIHQYACFPAPLINQTLWIYKRTYIEGVGFSCTCK
jgi:hypothetical protein